MEIELIAAVISGSIGVFAGLTQALGKFNKKLDRRFYNVESNLDILKNEVLHYYVLKKDFLRELQAVHTKLDRILDHLLAKS